MIELVALDLAGPVAPWVELGFAVEGERARIGATELRFGAAGRGIAGWTLAGAGPERIDGLPTTWVPEVLAEAPPRHPNGATRLDHVVVVTPDRARTEAALAEAGFELRRRREAGDNVQSFYRVGEVVLELVGRADQPAPAQPAPGPPAPAEGPARFWGLVVVVEDLDGLARRLGDRLGAIRDAVQPGRRIATVRREAGLGLPVAFMTP